MADYRRSDEEFKVRSSTKDYYSARLPELFASWPFLPVPAEQDSRVEAAPALMHLSTISVGLIHQEIYKITPLH